MKHIYILIIGFTFISNIYAEDLTDIQISAPILNSQDLTNEAIEDINTNEITENFITNNGEEVNIDDI